MSFHELRRRASALGDPNDEIQRNSDRSYADRPPPTPSPSSEYYLDYQQQSLYGPLPHNPSYLSTVTNIEESIPTYDETIHQDQLNRSSSSISIQRLNNSRQNRTPSPNQHHETSNNNTPSTNNNNSNNNNNNNSQTNISRRNTDGRNILKQLGLNFVNARQHLALASCRNLVMIPPLYHTLICFKRAIFGIEYIENNLDYNNNIQSLIIPGNSEHFIAGIWCLVAAYLSFSVVDGLMVRWIVTYQTTAAIVRVLSMSLLLITIEQITLAIFSPDGLYSLHTWILISCILTGAYILQNFVTSNLDLKNDRKPRSVDYYNITVYAVVPVGLASFVSMIGLLRALFILRVDIDRRDPTTLFDLYSTGV